MKVFKIEYFDNKNWKKVSLVVTADSKDEAVETVNNEHAPIKDRIVTSLKGKGEDSLKVMEMAA